MKARLSKFIFSLPIVSTSILTPSCNNANTINFANYESYMSIDLINSLNKSNNVNFIYYSTIEEMSSKFTKNYDIAIPTTYEILNLLDKGLISKIKWDQFDLYDANNNKIVKSYESVDLVNKLYVGGLASLLTTTTNKVIYAITNDNLDLFGENGKYPNTCLLDFMIPYFLQDLIFSYKGNEIKEINEAINWNKITDIISLNNSNLDTRFKPSRTSHIGFIDDPRTLYSLSSLIKNQQISESDQSKWNVNPSNPEQDIASYKNDYDYLSNKYKNGYFYFNSDSQQIIQLLANPNGNNSSFAYNGDILYAATGAEIYPSYDVSNFHVYRQKDGFNLLALDGIVINKKNENSHKEKSVYETIKAISLDGIDEHNVHIYDQDSNENYIYGPMINFNSVQYTSPYNSINKYVLDDANGYFSSYSKQQIELFQNIYNIDLADSTINITNIIEDKLSDIAKSNMHWAYSYEKTKM